MKRILITATLILFAGLPAKAGIIPINVDVTREGNYYRWTYDILVQSDTVVKTGDFFTIYDFSGFVAGSGVAPEGFEFSSAMIGDTPNRTLPSDSTLIPNLTFTYTGIDPITGPQEFHGFSALSRYGHSTSEAFTAQTHRQRDGVMDSNITDTTTPVPCVVPEPSTGLLLLAGIPLMALGYGYRRFRRLNTNA